MTVSLRHRIQQSEVAFLSSVSEGPAAVEAFYQTWSELQLDFQQALAADAVDEDTCAIAHQTASRIELLADFFLESSLEVDALTAAFRTDLEALFAELRIDESNHTSYAGLAHTPQPELSTPRAKLSSDSLPKYIEPAYSWLLQNLHNPYPSKEVKATISQKTNTRTKDIDSWFTDVRKRLGWHAIRKRYFGGKLQDTVDAATKTLRYSDFSSEHHIHFIAMEELAKQLYKGKLSQTVNTALVDVNRDVARAQSYIRRRRTAVVAMSYPSPERSLSRSPEPSTPTRSSGQKRRFPSELSDGSSDDELDRFRKRTRSSESHLNPACTLPSPPASVIEEPSNCPLNGRRSLSETYASPYAPTSLGKRKRTSSYNESPSSTKRHQVLFNELEPKEVPSPISTRASSPDSFFESWLGRECAGTFDFSDDVHSPVVVENFDERVVDDISYFDYGSSVSAFSTDTHFCVPSLKGAYPAHAVNVVEPLEDWGSPLNHFSVMNGQPDVRDSPLEGYGFDMLDPQVFGPDTNMFSPFTMPESDGTIAFPEPSFLSFPDLHWFSPPTTAAIADLTPLKTTVLSDSNLLPPAPVQKTSLPHSRFEGSLRATQPLKLISAKP